MKILKTILLTLAFLLVGTASVMADAASPQTVSYLNPTTGQATSVQATPIASNSELEFGNSGDGNWYVIGNISNDSTNPSVTNVSGVTLKNTGDSTETQVQGTINIIIAGNGDASQGILAGVIWNTTPWELNSCQKLNIYQQANTSGENGTNTISLGNCIFAFYNTPAQTSPSQENGTESPSALQVNGGGEFNIYSGVFAPTASNAPGLAVNQGGKVTVASTAQLQPTIDYNYISGTEIQKATANGLALNDTGTLTNSGYLAVLQNENTSKWDYAGINSTTGLSTGSNGGTIQTTTEFPGASTSLANGVWIQSSENLSAGKTNPVQATNNQVTAFGTATLNTGFIPGMTLVSPNSFTVNPGAILTIPNNYTLTFGTNSSATSLPTLSISSGATLIIQADANVTMNKDSNLENSGNIEVQQNSIQR